MYQLMVKFLPPCVYFDNNTEREEYLLYLYSKHATM